MTDKQTRAYTVRHHQEGLCKLEKATEILDFDIGSKLGTLGINGKPWKKMSISGKACAFCVKYPGCTSCPIKKITKRLGCFSTPWEELFDALEAFDLPAARKAQKAEIEFLLNLEL